MAMINVAPVQVSVRCDPFTGTPRVVRAAGDVLDVLEVERVRDESKAYPIGDGPRTLFVVRTGSARLRLAFGHRDRRWSVVGVDPMGDTLPSAA
ncbi:MAG: hypothetical protein U0869_14740 [Chloroflexota bacterium]